MKIKQSTFAVLLLSLLGCTADLATPQSETITPSFSKNTIPGVTLEANFSDPNNQMGSVFDFFDVSVRTEKASSESTPATFGRAAKVNTVRMLGGWAKSTSLAAKRD